MSKCWIRKAVCAPHTAFRRPIEIYVARLLYSVLWKTPSLYTSQASTSKRAIGADLNTLVSCSSCQGQNTCTLFDSEMSIVSRRIGVPSALSFRAPFSHTSGQLGAVL